MYRVNVVIDYLTAGGFYCSNLDSKYETLIHTLQRKNEDRQSLVCG
ncbi:MAG: hypothetical protein FWB86_11480 [Treponema sp.]|nr:hypothetical protein [Treponema sp.]